MRRRKKTIIALCLFLLGLLGLWGCSSPSSDSTVISQKSTETTIPTPEQKGEQTQSGLVYESSMELQYAENFTVDYYQGGYTLLTTTMDGGQFLIVPEGKEPPTDLEEKVVVFQRPMKDIYLVASAVMDMFS